MYTLNNPFPHRSILATVWELAAWRELMTEIAESLANRS